MSYIVLARKWRPRRFEDLIGQEHVSRTLVNAIGAGRVAHAFLFTGVRGVGKTSAARILAMALNCEKGDGPTVEPCGECGSCTRIMNASALDVQEIDGASNNSVEDVRHLRETIAFQPSHSRLKVYIIDEVHMLSASAFNALLKTLEEPPPHVKFILATTEPHRIPVTILSRCQRYDFRRIPPRLIEEHLRRILGGESISIEDRALALVAREAQGSMRDALSLVDQILAAFGEAVKIEDVSWLMGVADHRMHADLTRAVLGRDPRSCLGIIAGLDRDGYNLPHFVAGYLEHVRDLIVVRAAGADAPGADIPAWERDELSRLVDGVPLPELYRIFTHAARAADGITRSPVPRVMLETTFIKLSQDEPLTTVARLLQALGDLKRRGGLPAPPSAGRSAAPPPGPGQAVRSRDQGASGTEPAAVHRPAAGATPEDCAEVRPRDGRAASKEEADLWKRILEETKSSSPVLGRILERATPIRVDGYEVRIGYDAEAGFDSSVACGRDSVTALEEVCTRILGSRPAVLVERDSVQASRARQDRDEKRRKEDERRQRNARMHPAVRGAEEHFGARIRDIKTDVE